jgi:hypothetical protein
LSAGGVLVFLRTLPDKAKLFKIVAKQRHGLHYGTRPDAHVHPTRDVLEVKTILGHFIVVMSSDRLSMTRAVLDLSKHISDGLYKRMHRKPELLDWFRNQMKGSILLCPQCNDSDLYFGDILAYCKGFYEAHTNELHAQLSKKDLALLSTQKVVFPVPRVDDDAGWAKFGEDASEKVVE